MEEVGPWKGRLPTRVVKTAPQLDAESPTRSLQTTEHDSPLALEFGGVPLLVGTTSIFEALTVVAFQHAMLSAEALLTETAITNYGLCGRSTCFLRAARLVGLSLSRRSGTGWFDDGGLL